LRPPWFTHGGESRVAQGATKVSVVIRLCTRQADCIPMEQEQQTVPKTYQYKLKPTPQQERALETVLWRCRTLYNCALEQRKTWWERGQGKGATYYQQQAELPDLKAACPECAEVNAHVLQDVLLRVERSYQAFFRRVQAGQTPGFPRFEGRG